MFTLFYFFLLPLRFVFFFQAEDGIRDAQESRGLGDVYKRQHHHISDCVEVVFDKALEEKLFLELYAIFFQQLFMVERERKLQGLIDASGPNLRTALIQKAQNEFNIAKGKFDNEFKEKNDLSDNEEYINLQHRFMDILTVSYTHLRAHETPEHLVCRLLLEKKKRNEGGEEKNRRE
eukprot:TRINITY_DN35074_c0_g1_i1.p1 TRINITY_DN35074_c0_g1~~TRINITY_DN35074_c0_g1_i1.p1  ORF type:complete len:177 (+),score=73.23 TRINITY_DN35074_c0_g1_i1:2-532(+)